MRMQTDYNILPVEVQLRQTFLEDNFKENPIKCAKILSAVAFWKYYDLSSTCAREQGFMFVTAQAAKSFKGKDAVVDLTHSRFHSRLCKDGGELCVPVREKP